MNQRWERGLEFLIVLIVEFIGNDNEIIFEVEVNIDLSCVQLGEKYADHNDENQEDDFFGFHFQSYSGLSASCLSLIP